MIYYIILIMIIMYILFIVFLYLLKIKIEKFEKQIIQNFKEKNNQISSIFEVTKKFVNKHDKVFNESISLKKKDFSENSYNLKLIEKSNTYKKIHYELNFIFKVCNKNPKLNKNWKYLYIRDIIIDKSFEIGKKVKLLKKIVNAYNNLIVIKNITIIWLLIPIKKKNSI